jgi:hypothetical protein
MLPRSFDNLFLRTKQVHKYYTRNSNLYHIPFRRTKIRQLSVIYQAPKFFNSLGRNIRDASAVYCFQSKLKNYLFSL